MRSDITTRSYTTVAQTAVSVTLLAVLAGPTAASAQSFTEVSIGPGPGHLGNQLLEGISNVPVQRRTSFEILEQTPTILRFRIAFVVGVDFARTLSGPDDSYEGLDGVADISFDLGTGTSGRYRLDASLRGALTTVNDGLFDEEAGQAAVSISDVSLFGQPFLASATTRGPTSSTGATAVDVISSKFLNTGPTGAALVRLRWSVDCLSLVAGRIGNGGECAARFGLPIAYANDSAGEYPGIGNRNAADDGLFVTIELVSSGTSTPTLTRTPTRTQTPTPTNTFTPTATPTPSATPTVPLQGFHVDNVSVLEGDTGTRIASFQVHLDGPRQPTAMVRAVTEDGTALAGGDYAAAAETLTFGPLEDVKAFNVTIFGDERLEPNEFFFVKLGKASGATIGGGSGVGTILNDDGVPVGVAELVPPISRVDANEVAMLTLRWLHPERWRALDTVDLRLVDDQGVAFWSRFDEEAGTFSLCDANGVCGEGLVAGTNEIAANAQSVLYLAESVVVGSGPTGPSVDLTFAFSLEGSNAGRVLRVEAAAKDDDGVEQDFAEVGRFEVDTGGNGGDGCTIAPAGTDSWSIWPFLWPAILLARAFTRPTNRHSRIVSNEGRKTR